MALTEDQYRKISAWFAGTMTESERQAFLLEVAADPELQEQFEFGRLLNSPEDHWKDIPELVREAKEDENYLQYKQQLESIRRNADEHTASIIPMRRKSWWVAAAVIIIIGGVTWYLLSQKKSSPIIVKDIHKVDTPEKQIQPPPVPDKTQLAYEQFYNPYTPADITPIELQQVAALYKKKDYINALHELQSISEIRGNAPQDEKQLQVYAHFYNGLCQLSLQQPDSARVYLQKAYALKKNVPVLQNDITWYLALTWLKLQQPAQAKPLLTTLTGNTGSKKYQQQATSLLEQLR